MIESLKNSDLEQDKMIESLVCLVCTYRVVVLCHTLQYSVKFKKRNDFIVKCSATHDGEKRESCKLGLTLHSVKRNSI